MIVYAMDLGGGDVDPADITKEVEKNLPEEPFTVAVADFIWDNAIARAMDKWSPVDANLCDVCGKRLSPPFLYWDCHKSIAAHRKCLSGVLLGLVRDLIELRFGRKKAEQFYLLRKTFPVDDALVEMLAKLL